MVGLRAIRRKLKGLSFHRASGERRAQIQLMPQLTNWNLDRVEYEEPEETEATAPMVFESAWAEALAGQQAAQLMPVARAMNRMPETLRQEPRYRKLSTLERLPDELLLKIMKYVDRFDLYCLTQASDHLFRLSLDNTFEDIPAWRTLRHTDRKSVV